MYAVTLMISHQTRRQRYSIFQHLQYSLQLDPQFNSQQYVGIKVPSGLMFLVIYNPAIKNISYLISHLILSRLNSVKYLQNLPIYLHYTIIIWVNKIMILFTNYVAPFTHASAIDHVGGQLSKTELPKSCKQGGSTP